MKQLDLKGYLENVENRSGTSVIKFGAQWCGPCKAYDPILHQISETVGDKVEFYEVDVDAEPELSNKFKIRGVPATFIMQNGKIEKSLMGVQNSSTIIELLKNI